MSDLLAKAKGRQLSMEAVASAKFDPRHRADFESFASYVLNPPKPPQGRWPGCDYAEQWAALHGMVRAAQLARTRSEALSLWAEADRVQSKGEKAASRPLTKIERLRPTQLGRDLARRVIPDQAWREALVDTARPEAEQEVMEWRVQSSICTVDAQNSAFVRTLLKTRRWPLMSIDGSQASHDAWLLVQHADDDRALQKAALLRMKMLVRRHEASGTDYAYLSDRIEVAEGRRQRFGTQFTTEQNGCVRPSPIINPPAVDKRRARVGLATINAYARELAATYKRPLCH